MINTNKINQTGFVLGEKLSEKELCPDKLLKGQEEAFLRDIERIKLRYSEFVNVLCPACNSKEYEFALKKLGFEYVTCSSCKTLYMSPRPSPEIMTDYYANSENYKYWAKYIFPVSENSRREKIHKPWLDRILFYCAKYSIYQGTLMEVGAGFGTFSELALKSRKFEKVLALDPNPDMAASCRARGIQTINARIEDLKEEVNNIDVVVAFEMIEHLFEPKIFLNQCSKIIKSGGLLVLSCPNGQGFDISLLRGDSLAIDAEHVNLFNPHSLSLLIESCGFKVLEVTTPGRLDAEFVHEAIKTGKYNISNNPFLKRILLDDWDKLGWKFQQFLADNGLSSHMWLAARKK